MTRSLHARRTLLAGLTALSLLLPIGASHAGVPAAVGHTPSVDPALLAAVGAGVTPAVLAFDDEVATRAEVLDYLNANDIAHSTFSALSMIVGCARSAADIQTLAAAPGALSVWGDEKMTPAFVPGSVSGVDSDVIDTALASGIAGVTGDGVGIAVLDTGIDGGHADLEFGRKTLLNARVLLSHMELMGPGNEVCAPNQYQEGLSDSETVSGQGTHLASVAAGDGKVSNGQYKGVAPGAALVGVNLLEHATPEVTGDVSVSLIRFLAGVNYVIDNALEDGPTIAKVALLGWTSQGLFDPWHPHMLAIRDLHEFGMSVVVPVGNGGSAASKCDVASTCHFNRMAVGEHAIGVGATKPAAGGVTLAEYSSGGDPEPRMAREDMYRYEPTLVAPGTSVIGARRAGLAMVGAPSAPPYGTAGQGSPAGDDPTNPQYMRMTGTSVAAANVAGTIALMQEAARDAKGCFLTPDQVRQILEQTAKPVGGFARWQVGAGAVDAPAAVAAAVQAPKLASADLWVCPPSK